ncbi:MAG TPA: DUF4148 domain-containing protein, partial [Burkholderiaceae bacterium]|nr:DUF4148 domain-containing protein [Burkholderiaceae bacterium]
MKTKHMFAVALLAGVVGVASAEGFAEGYGPGNLDLYGDAPGVAKARAQVQADLAEARRHGLIVYGEADIPQDEAVLVAVKTRAQVQAELAEARRLGLIVYGEADIPSTTPEQERM